MKKIGRESRHSSDAVEVDVVAVVVFDVVVVLGDAVVAVVVAVARSRRHTEVETSFRVRQGGNFEQNLKH